VPRRSKPDRQRQRRGCLASRRPMPCRGHSHMPNRGRYVSTCLCAGQHHYSRSASPPEVSGQALGPIPKQPDRRLCTGGLLNTGIADGAQINHSGAGLPHDWRMMSRAQSVPAPSEAVRQSAFQRRHVRDCWRPSSSAYLRCCFRLLCAHGCGGRGRDLASCPGDVAGRGRGASDHGEDRSVPFLDHFQLGPVGRSLNAAPDWMICVAVYA
jgi:hypothetical protein